MVSKDPGQQIPHRSVGSVFTPLELVPQPAGFHGFNFEFLEFYGNINLTLVDLFSAFGSIL